MRLDRGPGDLDPLPILRQDRSGGSRQRLHTRASARSGTVLGFLNI